MTNSIDNTDTDCQTDGENVHCMMQIGANPDIRYRGLPRWIGSKFCCVMIRQPGGPIPPPFIDILP
ncbi:MAG: hypothetical protein AAFP90_16900 [Planctomycetota bacterium]